MPTIFDVSMLHLAYFFKSK